MNWRFLIYVFLFLLSHSTYSQKVITLNSSETGLLGHYLSIFEDQSKNLSIDNIIEDSNKFIPSQKEVPSFTHSSSAYWIRFYVQNNTDKDDYHLVVDNPLLEELEIYTIYDGKPFLINKIGMKYPFDERKIARTSLIYPIEIPQGKIGVYYLRFSSRSNLIMPIRISTNQALIKDFTLEDMFHGFFYGILVFAILMNLFIYIRVYDISYILYTIFLILFILYISYQTGHLFQFILPNRPGIITFSGILFGNLSTIVQLFFIRSFLQSKTRSPKLHKIGYILQIGNLLSIIAFAFSQSLSVFLIAIFGIFSMPYMIIIGLSVYWDGFKPARFYLIATIGKLIMVNIFTIQYYGIIPYTLIGKYLVEIAEATETILFALALGDKYLTYKNELEAAQAELNKELELKLINKEKANKEQEKINKRLLSTQGDLVVSNKTLINTNKTLDNFVYTASHDLKAPIANMEGLITLIKESPKGNTEALSMLETSVSKLTVAIKGLEVVHEIININANDITVNNLNEVIEEVKKELSEEIEAASAVIRTDFSNCNEVKFSKRNIKTIFYQLINNAIKFKAKNRKPEIFICSQHSEHFVLISIRDNGEGIPANQHHKIFGMFKKYHLKSSGTGVGLYLVKNIVDNANGRIMVNSEIGKGTEFKIFLRNT